MMRGVIVADDGTTNTVKGAPGQGATSDASLKSISIAAVTAHLILFMMNIII